MRHISGATGMNNLLQTTVAADDLLFKVNG